MTSNFPLVQYFQDAWTGANSPQGQAVFSTLTQGTAQAAGAAVAPSIGLPPNVGGAIVASAPAVAKRQVGLMTEVAYWRALRTPLLLGGAGALIAAVAMKSKGFGVVGVLALGGYLYGRSKYE